MSTDGSFEKLVKHEVLCLIREKEKLDKSLGGIKNMNCPAGRAVRDRHRS